MIQIIRAKLHGIRVTGSALDYHGSITLDPEMCDRAGFYPLEFVDIWNKNSGARISTYIIFGESGSQCCVLNGAAARTCQVGDELIIAASAFINDPRELHSIKPKILVFGPGNTVLEELVYDVFESPEKAYNFRILHK